MSTHILNHRKSWLLVLTFAFLGKHAYAGGFCPTLPPPDKGDYVIDVDTSQTSQLPSIVASAPSGAIIRLADGVYNLNGLNLTFNTTNVTLRSASGNPESVILDGNLDEKLGRYISEYLLRIFASNITIAEVTVTRAYYHPIHITPNAGADTIDNVRLYRIRVIDPGSQAIKVNPTSPTNYISNLQVSCSEIKLTDIGRPYIRNNCYTGGIDAHKSYGSIVRDNRVEGFWCPSGLSDPSIFFWRTSQDTLVERNYVYNNVRGIGFGLGSTEADGHVRGMIRNNVVFADRKELFQSQASFSSGIGLESASDVKVLHNTVMITLPTTEVRSAIFWRFPLTTAYIANNAASHHLRPRDGGQATLGENLQVIGIPDNFFVNPAAGDFHLLSTAESAIDRGTKLEKGQADEDMDGDLRALTAPPDIGADEFVPKP